MITLFLLIAVSIGVTGMFLAISYRNLKNDRIEKLNESPAWAHYTDEF
jgi:hypothetical protein